MEEKQVGSENSGSGTCHAVGSCASTCEHMHKLCFRHCCMVKCFAIIIVLAVVFGAGFCAGSHGLYRHHLRGGYQNYEQRYGQFDQYGGQFRGMMGVEGYQNSGRNMMYRVSGTPSVTVSTPPVVPVIIPAPVQ